METSKDTIISLLLEQGEQLKQAISRSLAEDDVVLTRAVALRDVDTANHTVAPSTVIDYLLGKPMTVQEETKVLHTLKELPLVDNIISTLTVKTSDVTDHEEIVPLTVSDSSTPRSSILSVTNVLRLRICVLELSEAGLRFLTPSRLFNQPSQQKTPPVFLIEYQQPRACPGQTGHPVRLCSRKVSGKGIVFGQEKLHTYESNKPITFHIYFRHHYHRTTTLLGTAKLEWDTVLNASVSECELTLPVYHVSKHGALGRLKVKVQLGEEGMLIGRPRTYRGHESHNKGMARSVCSTSGPPSEHACERKQEESEQKYKNLNDREKAILLRGLVHITQSRGFTLSDSSNLFLVLKAFWMDDVLKSQVAWNSRNPCFKLHETVPVLLSPFFLSQCRGKHAVLEIWNAHSNGDRLIGIAKLPLHTFYLAYHDPEVTKELMTSKLPVVSVDNWVPVMHPVMGDQAGELLVLLAFGSDEQVIHLEHRRGLRLMSLSDPNPQPITVPTPIDKVELENFTETHKFDISILKISQFSLFESLPNGVADCFVDYRLPVTTVSGVTYKSYVSDLTLCTLEPRFNSQHTYITSLPVSTSVAAFLASNLGLGVQFRVMCRLYKPELRDILVAQAILPILHFTKLEEQFSKSKKAVNTKISLPLTIVTSSETAKLCKKSCASGCLMLDLAYSNYSEHETDVKQLSNEVLLASLVLEPEKQLETSAGVHTDSTQTAMQMCDFAEVEEINLIDLTCLDLDSPLLSPPDSPRRSDLEADLLQNFELPILEPHDVCIQVEQASAVEGISQEAQLLSQGVQTDNIPPPPTFRAHIQVKQAAQLPCFSVTMQGTVKAPPSTYVTLQGEQADELLISPIVRHSCTPYWDWHCDTHIPAYLLFLESRHLIFKMWHPMNCEEGADPATDHVLCFAAVNLAALLSGYPQISGWQVKSALEARHHTVPPPFEPSLPQQLPQEQVKLFELQPSPFDDLTSSAIEIKFQEQLSDLDLLTLELQEKVSDLKIESVEPPPRPEPTTSYPGLDSAVPCCSGVSQQAAEVEESEDDDDSSIESVDSDVAKMIANFDLDTLRRLVEQLDDEAEKAGRCSKPDFVCRSSQTSVPSPALTAAPTISRQAPEGGNPVDKSQISMSQVPTVANGICEDITGK
ncbi:hypothetical protein B566_EDAN011457 [Ephemera danica]|nr:hypothetical protein B566_EDAN011457 [Ephemera danica]